MLLKNVTRQSDGKNIYSANFWQTSRTVQADHSIIHENLLRFADNMPNRRETYTLTYIPRPNEPATAMSIKLYTADNTQVPEGGTTAVPVAKAVVEFTKPMRALYYQHFMLTVDDYSYTSGETTVEQLSDGATFVIDLSALEVIPGSHTLTILTHKLKDLEGNRGKGTIEAKWTETANGMANITFEIAPSSEAGNINKPSDRYPVGPLHLVATPTEGHLFDRWTCDGVLLSRDAAFDYTVIRNATLRAHFKQLTYDIIVECNEEQGQLTGYASGVYEWGEELRLAAAASEGYEFDRWLCDDETLATTPSCRVKVNGNHTFSALFKKQTLGINEVDYEITRYNSAWYTLQGLRLSHKPTAPGLYIHGGKVIRLK